MKVSDVGDVGLFMEERERFCEGPRVDEGHFVKEVGGSVLTALGTSGKVNG